MLNAQERDVDTLNEYVTKLQHFKYDVISLM